MKRSTLSGQISFIISEVRKEKKREGKNEGIEKFKTFKC